MSRINLLKRYLKKLLELYDRQKQFESYFVDLNSDSVTKQKVTKELCLSLITEVVEALRELNWKMHIKKRKRISKKRLLEELCDIIIFVFDILLIWNFSFKEVVNMLDYKIEKNYKRFIER